MAQSVAAAAAVATPAACTVARAPPSPTLLPRARGPHGMAALLLRGRGTCTVAAAAGAAARWTGRGLGAIRRRTTTVRAAWKQEVLWASAPVSDVAPAAEDLFHLTLDVSGVWEVAQGYTAPGQFVQVRVGGLDKPVFLAISSPPAPETGRLEFLIKRGPAGTAAAALCELPAGARVEVSQVMGAGFDVARVRPAAAVPTLLLFATGSGISPLRALVEAGALDARSRADVRLFYGARNLERMALRERFPEWEAAGVRVVPVLSQPGKEWDGERGYVQAAFARSGGLVSDAAAKGAGAVLCGHKGMAEEVTAMLVEQGVPKDKILLNF